jgi:hypothetical protein
MNCRHCGHTPAGRPRGLCWSCYERREVRALYDCPSKFARRGIEDFYGRFQLPAAPTTALPGTPEKVAVLIMRAACRQALWHPQDAPAHTVRVELSA